MITQHTIRRRMSATTPALLALILLGFVLAATLLGDRATARMAAETLIRVTMVVGFWIFVGNSGVVSFGHAAFGCIGAYVSAWLTLKPAMKATLLPGLPGYLAAADWRDGWPIGANTTEVLSIRPPATRGEKIGT